MHCIIGYNTKVVVCAKIIKLMSDGGHQTMPAGAGLHCNFYGNRVLVRAILSCPPLKNLTTSPTQVGNSRAACWIGAAGD